MVVQVPEFHALVFTVVLELQSLRKKITLVCVTLTFCRDDQA